MDTEQPAQQNVHPIEQFVGRVHKRLQRMDLLMLELRQDGSDNERLSELRSMFHNIAGTGGVYGFLELSRYSRRGEMLCEKLRSSGRRASPDELHALVEILEQLRGCLQEERAEATRSLLLLMGSTVEAPPLEVLILEGSDEARERLSMKVRATGLPVRGFSSAAELMEGLAQAPAAVIADASAGAHEGFKLLKQLRAMSGGSQTVIILCGTLAGFSDKVEAIRLGADACFEQNAEFSVVRDRLEELLQARHPHEASILVVDDDPEQSAIVRAVLQPVGYQVHSCKDPRFFDEELEAAKPDLIILDIVMPEILGHDLLRYIRQDKKYRHIPIIIISGIHSDDLRTEATLAGSDLQLQKPVAPAVLLRAVASCLENARRPPSAR